jgi:hypothetical protein
LIVPFPWKASILFFFSEELDPLDVAGDALVLEAHHLLEVEFRGRNFDAEIGEMVARFREEFGGMEQRLRRDAANVETRPAMSCAFLDDGRLEPELGCPDGAHIAAGAGADDNEVVGHCSIYHSAAVRRAL